MSSSCIYYGTLLYFIAKTSSSYDVTLYNHDVGVRCIGCLLLHCAHFTANMDVTPSLWSDCKRTGTAGSYCQLELDAEPDNIPACQAPLRTH